MPTIKTRAVVLKARDMGESNKRLTLMAKDMGKIQVSARGAKNLKSKFLAAAQPFCYCDFVLYEGKDFFAVAEADLIRNFSVFYNDIFKLAYGTYFMELIDKSVMASQEANDILFFLLKSLQILEVSDNPKKISAAFQIKLLDFLGLRPNLDFCGLCGEHGANNYFSSGYGFICGKCAKNCGIPVAYSIIKAFAYILDDRNKGSISEVFMFDMPPMLIDELHNFALELIKNQLDFTPNSLQLLDSL